MISRKATERAEEEKTNPRMNKQSESVPGASGEGK